MHREDQALFKPEVPATRTGGTKESGLTLFSTVHFLAGEILDESPQEVWQLKTPGAYPDVPVVIGEFDFDTVVALLFGFFT